MGAENVRVAAYCRVSTEKDEQLMSLENQKQFFEAYAQKGGMTLVNIYADEGISGTRLKNRRAFQQLLSDAERGLFERVLVKDVSRMARNVVDFLQSVRRLRAIGVDCQFITSGMSLSDGELTLTILAAVAQEESANLSGRVKFGKQKNAAQGRVPNLVYGYDKVPGEYFSLHINAHEATVVRQVFDWYASGAYGANRIARMLNEQGERTKRGCAFTQAAVRRLLSHRIYIGEVVNGREYIADYLTGRRAHADADEWKIVQNPALAIVPKEQFDAVQTVLSGRSGAFGGNARYRAYAWSGLIRCASCGQGFRRLVRKTKAGESVRWVCGGRNLNGVDFCCNRTALSEQELLASLTAYLRTLMDETLVHEVQRACAQLMPPDGDRNEAERALQKARRAKQRLLALYEAEAVTMEELQERMDILRRDEENACVALEKSTAPPPTPEISPLKPEELDSELLHALVERVTVSPDGRAVIRLRDMAG